MTKPTTPRVLRLLWLLFFCTGFSGLLLEQGFERWLSTVVGTSRQSGAIVLALYFVGLALGARLFAPLAKRIADGIRLYALLEAVVGVYALILSVFAESILRYSTELVALVAPDSGGAIGVRIVVGALWILPPTLAMGGTFPAVVRALEQRNDPARLTRGMSSLYAANLLGAFIAALSAPYLLFAYIGVDGAILLVAGLQAVIVTVALQLSQVTKPEVSAPDAVLERHGVELRNHSAGPVIALAFFSGLAVFAFEVVWIHLIGAAIGMSAFAFSLMLVCVLLGLGLASAMVARLRGSGRALDNSALGVAFLLAAFAAVVSLQLWDRSSDILMLFGSGASGFYQGEIARFLTAAILLLPGSVTLGLIYPLLFRIELFPDARAALVSSQMTMANAIGSMLGALGTGFLLIHTMGAQMTLRLLCSLLGVAALLVLVSAQRRTASGRWAKLALGVVATALILAPVLSPKWDYLRLLSGVNVYFQPLHADASDELLFLGEDNVSGFTTVTRKRVLARGGESQIDTLFTNGKFQGNNAGEVPAQVAFAYLPSVYARGRDAALVIGLGTGVSAAAIDGAGFAHTDVVELSPTIAEAARLFRHINRDVLSRPTVHLHVDDGRTHLTRMPDGSYDVISIELTSVWFAGATNLYSREFYQLARARLKPDGVFQQWLQLHHLGNEEVMSIIATLRSVFAHVRLHFVGGQGILIASQRALVYDPAHALVTSQRLATYFEGVSGVTRGATPRMVDTTLALDGPDTTRLLTAARRSSVTLNSDLNRYLEYWSPRYNLDKQDHILSNLQFLLGFVDRDELGSRARNLGFTLKR